MNDRELLELAAKAVGREIRWGWVNPDGVLLYEDQAYIGGSPWNPLSDDGDALRLLGKLSIGLHWCKSGRVYAHHDDVEECESSREDRQANMRRAIVSAAAEIGRSMP